MEILEKMDDGEDDERAAAECMREAREAAAVAIRAGLAEDRALKLAAIAAIEAWRISLMVERQNMTGEPVLVIAPVYPPSSSQH